MDAVDRNQSCSYEKTIRIVNLLEMRTKVRPRIGIICGTGLTSIADHLEDTYVVHFQDIPHFPVATVEGHEGRMIFGRLGGMPVVALQGRCHYYEGYTLATCSLPIRVMKTMGVKYLFVTNAAGGLNPQFKVGDLMILHDHINLMGLAGNSPLIGANDSRFGPRFVSMMNPYDKQLIGKAREIANELGQGDNVHEGVYMCVGGPNYETEAELRMLRIMGVDAVGMSTVHEVLTARHCGLTVFAFSVITNVYDPNAISPQSPVDHADVLKMAKVQQDFCAELVKRLAVHIRLVEEMDG